MKARTRVLLLAALAAALLLAVAVAWVLSLPQFGGKLEGERLAQAQ